MQYTYMLGSEQTEPHPQAPCPALQYSLCNEPLIELSNPGASGSVFYVTSDDEFIIKTVMHKEAEFLQKLLPGYYMVRGAGGWAGGSWASRTFSGAPAWGSVQECPPQSSTPLRPTGASSQAHEGQGCSEPQPLHLL